VSSLLLEAQKLIEDERAGVYGDSVKNHARIAALWSALLEKEITAHQVYLCLIAVKMSRLMESPTHRDSWMDIAGYAALAEKE
jgi:hypothetical protein